MRSAACPGSGGSDLAIAGLPALLTTDIFNILCIPSVTELVGVVFEVGVGMVARRPGGRHA